MTEPCSLHVIEDSAELPCVLPEWQTLCERCPNATPFQSPAWLTAWWRAFAPGELHAICMRADGRLIGFAPFYVETLEGRRRVLPVGIGVSDYLDVLLDPAYARPAGVQLSRYIGDMLSHCAAWELSELAPEATALTLPTPPGAREDIGVCSVCPVLTFTPGARGLADVLPSHRMQAVRTGWNRARRLGQFAIGEAGAEVSACWLSKLDQLHRARWEASGERGVTGDPRVGRFLGEAVPALLQRHQACLYRLQQEDRSVAIHLLLVSPQGMFSYLTGYDLSVKDISPGTLLLAHAIEQALARGRPAFHFLRGEEPYKRLWGARPRANVRRTFTAG